MRSLLLTAVLGVGVLALGVPQAEASWLSQALKGNRRDPAPYCAPYVQPAIANYAPYPGATSGYYAPGAYYQAPPVLLPPPAPRCVPNISGTWFANGDPNRVCQVVQWRLDGR